MNFINKYSYEYHSNNNIKINEDFRWLWLAVTQSGWEHNFFLFFLIWIHRAYLDINTVSCRVEIPCEILFSFSFFFFKFSVGYVKTNIFLFLKYIWILNDQRCWNAFCPAEIHFTIVPPVAFFTSFHSRKGLQLVITNAFGPVYVYLHTQMRTNFVVELNSFEKLSHVTYI